jgi:hypothetical protein
MLKLLAIPLLLSAGAIARFRTSIANDYPRNPLGSPWLVRIFPAEN